ncbi:hypothetical protein D3C86_1901230 [compost metagenome]
MLLLLQPGHLEPLSLRLALLLPPSELASLECSMPEPLLSSQFLPQRLLLGTVECSVDKLFRLFLSYARSSYLCSKLCAFDEV